jgi:hypothetical protein
LRPNTAVARNERAIIDGPVAWDGPIPLPHRGGAAHRLPMQEELLCLDHEEQGGAQKDSLLLNQPAGWFWTRVLL